MLLSVMFFSSTVQNYEKEYDFVFDIARLADDLNFEAIWTPERHFHEFGGIFPNPALTSMGLAFCTKNIKIRAGSLISPLHNAIRIAEDWSVIDNVSQGRVGISFGSGWNVNDFVFFPERYSKRHEVMYEQIEEVRQLWSGKQIMKNNAFNQQISIKIFPTPLQKKLPIWITSSGNTETFKSAGSIGANVLTHMIGQNLEALANNINEYRESRNNHNYEGKGIVSLMLHTYVSDSEETALLVAKEPFKNYLKSSINLVQLEAEGVCSISGGLKMPNEKIDDDLIAELLEITFDKYYLNASLIGDYNKCSKTIKKFYDIGVDEICCLIDFGVDNSLVKENLYKIIELK